MSTQESPRQDDTPAPGQAVPSGHEGALIDAEQTEIIEVDGYSTDNDSAYGDELNSFTTSLNSSAYQFPEEHGRTYHQFREGRYLLPNDEQEADRLDIHNELILSAMHRKLHLAPLPQDIQSAIDLGTGTGIWAQLFADQYPSCEVKANDLSPTQPTLVAPNLQFYIDDIEDDWALESHSLDFVHARFLAGAILNWPRLIKQAYENLKPGGFAEFQDWDTRIYSADNTLPPSNDLYTFHQITCDSQEQRGYNMSPGRSLEQWMKEAGFVNVVTQKYILPLGTWPRNPHFKRVGGFNYLQLDQSLEGIALATLTRGGTWSFEEVQVLVAKAKTEMKNRQIHGQYDFYVTYGQKPGES